MFEKKTVLANGWIGYWDRKEFLRNDFRFQDRLDGIVGMTVVKVIVDSQKFTMLCHDSENGKYLRVHIAESKYPSCNLRLTATEVEFKSQEEILEWIRKEDARREKQKRARRKKQAEIQAQIQAHAQS